MFEVRNYIIREPNKMLTSTVAYLNQHRNYDSEE